MCARAYHGGMSSDTYTQYAAIVEEMAHLEEKKAALRVLILSDMQEKDQEKVETVLGKFSIQRRKKWAYPDAVKEKEEAFKIAKINAEENGTATFTESELLVFTPVKL